MAYLRKILAFYSNILVMSFVLIIGATSISSAQETTQANNPLAQVSSISFQDQYTGDITGVNESANQFFLRYATPFEIGDSKWIGRLTVPISTVPEAGGGHESGLGDINGFASYLFDTGTPGVNFGIGPLVTLPTATNDVGSEKLSLGLANVMFNGTDKKFQWGYLATWQASVAGDDDKPDINIGAFQPFMFYQMGNGVYLRSSATSSYNFDANAYTVPVGLGVGKVFKTDKAVVNFFVEPQYTLFDKGDGQSEWGAFSGLNFQF